MSALSITALAVLFALPLLGGCKRFPIGGGYTREAEAEPPPAPRGTRELTASDGAGLLVHYGSPGQKRVLVYLHGKCDEPGPALEAFAGSVEGQGHVVAPRATEPCPNGKTMWTTDIDQLDAQIRAAVDAAEASAGARWSKEKQVLIGYSQGAARGEALVARQPRFAWTVFIGAPEAPSAEAYGNVTAASFLAGDKDRQDLMKRGEKALQEAGKPVRYLVLPGAEHGEFGPDGGRVMREAVGFVLEPTQG